MCGFAGMLHLPTLAVLLVTLLPGVTSRTLLPWATLRFLLLCCPTLRFDGLRFLRIRVHRLMSWLAVCRLSRSLMSVLRDESTLSVVISVILLAYHKVLVLLHRLLLLLLSLLDKLLLLLLYFPTRSQILVVRSPAIHGASMAVDNVVLKVLRLPTTST